MSVEVGAFGEVLAEETVGVVVGSTLPGTLGVAEVDVEVGLCAELSMLGHFDSLVPGSGSGGVVGAGNRNRGAMTFVPKTQLCGNCVGGQYIIPRSNALLLLLQELRHEPVRHHQDGH